MTSSPRPSCECLGGRGWGETPHPHPSDGACWPAFPRELREKIQPEILELIKQQRLNRLCEGSSFRKVGNRRRQGEPVGPPLMGGGQ